MLEGFRVKASEGEVVVLYFKPSATQNLKSSGFPEGETTWQNRPILRIHQWRYPKIFHFAMILAIIADHYLIFAMLFMQLRGQTCRCGFQYGDSIRLNSIADAER